MSTDSHRARRPACERRMSKTVGTTKSAVSSSSNAATAACVFTPRCHLQEYATRDIVHSIVSFNCCQHDDQLGQQEQQRGHRCMRLHASMPPAGDTLFSDSNVPSGTLPDRHSVPSDPRASTCRSPNSAGFLIRNSSRHLGWPGLADFRSRAASSSESPVGPSSSQPRSASASSLDVLLASAEGLLPARPAAGLPSGRCATLGRAGCNA